MPYFRLDPKLKAVWCSVVYYGDVLIFIALYIWWKREPYGRKSFGLLAVFLEVERRTGGGKRNLFRQTLYIFNVDLNIKCNPVVYKLLLLPWMLLPLLLLSSSQLRFLLSFIEDSYLWADGKVHVSTTFHKSTVISISDFFSQNVYLGSA